MSESHWRIPYAGEQGFKPGGRKVADFLGFWAVKKPATVSRAVSKLYPYGQKKEPRHKGRGLY